jgi:hypothetical protein
MMNAAHGRFLSEDPLQEHLNIASLHAYSYADNNPIGYGDPFGLICHKFTTMGAKQVYFNTLPAWTGWQEAGTYEHPHEPEMDAGYKGTNSAMAQAGGLKFGPPDNNAGGEFGFWPFFDEECIWVRYLASTAFWKQKITLHTLCLCPFQYSSSDGGFNFGKSDQVIGRKTTLTQGMSVLALDLPFHVRSRHNDATPNRRSGSNHRDDLARRRVQQKATRLRGSVASVHIRSVAVMG